MIGAARNRNIHVSDVQVRRTFDQIRREQFPEPKQFKAYLKSSGQTVADLLFRARLKILYVRNKQQVVAGRKGAARREALARFTSEFHRRWPPETYCARAYAVEGCAHVQAML